MAAALAATTAAVAGGPSAHAPWPARFRLLALLAVVVLAAVLLPGAAPARASVPGGERPAFTLAWTPYIGWAPWQVAEDAGIVRKWADAHGITIDVVNAGSYLESLTDFSAGRYDAVTITNMDAFARPPTDGGSMTALVVGGFSRGNDAIVARNARRLTDLKGRTVKLVMFSVSHYLLARAMEKAGLSRSDISLMNLGEEELVSALAADPDGVVVTWNPFLSQAAALRGATVLFDSASLPGEILDLTVVHQDTLAANPALGKALTAIWYETIALLTADTPEGAAARTDLARIMATDSAGVQSQLGTTHLFRSPQEVSAFLLGDRFRGLTNRIISFVFQQGLLGDVPSVDAVGVEMPDGQVDGNPGLVRLRFPLPMAEVAQSR
jgi:NitT/TauT family transport system substrate-binding protein